MIKKIIILNTLFLLVACQSNIEHNFSKEEITEESKKFGQRSIILENKGIRLVEIIDFPVFEDVTLDFLSKNAKYLEGKNKVEFAIKGFNLGEKTVAESDLELPLEEGGQYLLLSDINGKKHKKFSSHSEIELNQGENYLMAFLTRSYKMTLKSKSANLFLKITTTSSDGNISFEKSEPFVFLNAPEGSYDITKHKKILLDFSLFNIDINKKGNHLSVNIDGNEFKLFKSAPFYIEGLGIGKHSIKITLKDNKNEVLKGKLIKEITRDFEITDSSLFE